MMTNFSAMMKQAQHLQEKIGAVQKELEQHTEEGMSGGGMVKVLIDGKKDIKKLTLDPQVVNPKDIELLEDLITAAYNEAKSKMDAYSEEKMAKVTGSLSLPGGLKLPF